MNTWFDYRSVWAAYPWIAAYAVVVVIVLVVAIIGTVIGVPPLAILFIPSLAGAYVHHILVERRVDQVD